MMCYLWNIELYICRSVPSEKSNCEISHLHNCGFLNDQNASSFQDTAGDYIEAFLTCFVFRDCRNLNTLKRTRLTSIVDEISGIAAPSY